MIKLKQEDCNKFGNNKKKNSIQRLYKSSFNPKDFWEKAVEGRAHTNTSLYIEIYIVGDMMVGLPDALGPLWSE